MKTTILDPVDKVELSFAERYASIRNQTVHICQPLEAEDYVVQPVVDVSPPKWHLAHTTWFFENFLLQQYASNYQPFNSRYNYLFNSYYESQGERVLRPNRGNMTRPTVAEVYDYRKYVDEAVLQLLEHYTPDETASQILEIGLQHEQQHQELLLTDIKYILGHNPLYPVYREQAQPELQQVPDVQYLSVEEGLYEIGHEGAGFAFDNEQARHKIYLHGFKAANRLVTCGEYLEFMLDGGYEDFRHWYSDAWDWLKKNDVHAPLYWQQIDGQWMQYTLGGLKPIDWSTPVTHVSQYEAAAFAHWKSQRLLTEAEWEVFALQNSATIPEQANFVELGHHHPVPVKNDNLQLLGDCWEWTNSAYLPYPGYEQPKGALGEYNGKFMINQMVLRGGSCATPRSHIRHTYRNFFQPWHRWQFTGIRLAQNY